jgi:TRAP-type C4-dicarboxylate transport system substrate-binding protein
MTRTTFPGCIRSLAIIFAALAAGAVAYLPASPAAAQNLTLKLTTLDRENEITSHPLIWWMKTIGERTNKRVEIQPYWSSSLVAPPRTMSAVKSGIADAGYFVSALLSSEEKDFAPFDIDGALPTDATYLDVWPKIEPVVAKILDRHGVEVMWPRRSAKVVISCKNKFLTQASEYAGMKIRAAGRWESATITRWGAAPYAIPPADTYTALQSGTVDCTYHIYSQVWALKLFEVAPYITQTEESSAFTFIGLNKAKWNRISEADRATIKQISDEAMKREVEVLAQREKGIVEDMAKAGAKFHRPSPDEQKRLSDAVKPLWAEVRMSVGPNGVALADILEPLQKR